jgi:hypothetical protein
MPARSPASFAKVELGVDPAAERTQARAQALTLEVVARRYLTPSDRLRRALKAAERYFAKHGHCAISRSARSSVPTSRRGYRN